MKFTKVDRAIVAAEQKAKAIEALSSREAKAEQEVRKALEARIETLEAESTK